METMRASEIIHVQYSETAWHVITYQSVSVTAAIKVTSFHAKKKVISIG